MKKKIIILIIIIFVIFFAYIFIVKGLYSDITKRGLFGDMFGGLNALFSGLAFVGVIYAIVLQKEELGLQREELKLTREELRKSAEAQVKSEKALSKQAESLKLTAKLNGLSTIMQYKGDLINMQASSRHQFGVDQSLKQDCEDIQKEIENIIKDK